MKGIEPIRTNVGAAGYGDNFVRGASVQEALFGRASRWSLLSRFLDGPDLTREDAALLEDVLVATVAPDPRIWPLKIGWIVGAYGDWWAAGAAVQGMLAECRMGPWAGAAACPTVEALTELRARSADGYRTRVVEWAEERWRSGQIIWGFGVAGGQGRRRDERIDLIDVAVRVHGRERQPHYLAAMEGVDAIAEATGRQANMAISLAAVGLDLGLGREAIEAILYEVLEPQILGNAFEAARLGARALRELPSEAVQYAGPVARRSPRNEARP